MNKVKNRIGETATSFEGQLMTIIAYRNNKDIDIRFEDGVVVTNKVYRHFKSGTIKNPYKDALDRVGKQNTATNGQKMTIIAYHNYSNIDIRFEDGTIVLNKSYSEFKKGTILNPNAKTKTKKVISRVGETSLSKKDEKMTIIEYRGSSDIDVEFEDGTIVQHKSYNNFIYGLISNPNYSAKKYIGKTNTHKLTGQKMTIIAFRSCSDLDIQFEDGTIVYNKSWQNFRLGKINYSKLNRVGERKIANNGLWMEIVQYTDNNNMTVRFEDDTEVESFYSSFTKGNIAHPSLRLTGGSYFSRTSELYGFIINKLAFTYKDESNYICKCKNCGYKDILTTKEMLSHKC